MLNALFALLAVIQPAVPLAPAPTSAADVVTKVQAYYAGTKTLMADFRQQYTNTTFGRSSQSDGRLYVAKPGKMRWDYKTPDKRFFISDGTTLWVYEEAARQAFQQSLEDQILPVAVTFLYGKGDLSTEFTAALDPGKYGAKGDLVVKLTPRKPEAQYKNLWLVVDPADFHVKESVILEASDNVNHFRFINVKQNDAARIPDRTFKFVPPAGVRVVKGETPR
jgi:outer membrane lipoprotein carrier protein